MCHQFAASGNVSKNFKFSIDISIIIDMSMLSRKIFFRMPVQQQTPAGNPAGAGIKETK
jgi:hypothetical protein